MSAKDDRVALFAWVDPITRDIAREASMQAGLTFSAWVERAVMAATARESADRAMASVAPRARPTRAARPLSEAEQNARKPLSPLVLLGASEETIHTDTERVRAARVYRVEQDQE